MKTFWQVALFVLLQSALFDANAVERIALIIGNATYSQLGALANPSRDATQVEHELAALGFSTKLIIDANEQSLRREIRAFSARSEGASVALVYYAGHGAQINGDNYLLPVDLDAPNRESDIQLSAIKVDDLLVSLKTKVKIIFLDACRDNPVLFRNLSKGRGASFSRGLAAPKDSSSNTDASGGGIFIGYATDAGSIAADGNGQNSPFTEAFLRHIRKPVSIDDMFSMVTRDVRQATNNKQRPYKYASMETVVCLAPSCGTLLEAVNVKPIPLAANSPAVEKDIRLATLSNDLEKLSRISETYKNTNDGRAAQNALDNLRRLYTDEWVAVDWGLNSEGFYYYQPSTIRNGGGRTWVSLAVAEKVSSSLATDSFPKFFNSDGYGPRLKTVFTQVLDCGARRSGLSNVKEYDSSGLLIKSVFFGDPRIVDLPAVVPPKSIFDSLFGFVCPPRNAGRILPNEEIVSDKYWKNLVPTWDGAAITGTISVREDSIEVKGEEVTAILLGTGLRPTSTTLSMYDYNIFLSKSIFRCKAGKYAVLDGDYLSGSTLVAKERNILQWEVLIKGSTLEMVSRYLC